MFGFLVWVFDFTFCCGFATLGVHLVFVVCLFVICCFVVCFYFNGLGFIVVWFDFGLLVSDLIGSFCWVVCVLMCFCLFACLGLFS